MEAGRASSITRQVLYRILADEDVNRIALVLNYHPVLEKACISGAINQLLAEFCEELNFLCNEFSVRVSWRNAMQPLFASLRRGGRVGCTQFEIRWCT